MKRILKIIFLSLILFSFFCFDASADSLDDLAEVVGAYTLSDNLPAEAKDALSRLGIENNDFTTIQNISFDDIIGYIGETIEKETKDITPSLCVVLAILLIYSMFSGVFESSNESALSSVLSVVTALCIACSLLLPVTELIEKTRNSIETSVDFMLAYVPVMTAVLISSGQAVTGSGYSAMMLVASEAVGQFFSKIISPLLSLFMTLGISSSVVAEFKISGIIGFFAKAVKWLMSFVFTLFTAFLSLKTVFSSSVDNVSSRAVRYTMSSFIPVVGGALSEAYKTVHGSVGILKSGVGIFVIISVAVVFVPVLIRLILWLFTVNMCKSFAEVASLNSPVMMLSSVSTVLSLMLSVIFCIASLFIITTALIISIGGA